MELKRIISNLLSCMYYYLQLPKLIKVLQKLLGPQRCTSKNYSKLITLTAYKILLEITKYQLYRSLTKFWWLYKFQCFVQSMRSFSLLEERLQLDQVKNILTKATTP